eukprot:764497-Hanusia_phi.AAC.4
MKPQCKLRPGHSDSEILLPPAFRSSDGWHDSPLRRSRSMSPIPDGRTTVLCRGPARPPAGPYPAPGPVRYLTVRGARVSHCAVTCDR